MRREADVAEDGSVRFQDTPSFHAKVLPCLRSGKEMRRCAERLDFPILRGGFDLTDWAERVVGNDPYRYEKKKYLEATRAEREKMARAALRDLLRDAVLAAPAILRSIWRDDSLTTAEKRRLLRVNIADAAKADEMFTILMGEEVAPRRQFIEDNALNVSNLDV